MHSKIFYIIDFNMRNNRRDRGSSRYYFQSLALGSHDDRRETDDDGHHNKHGVDNCFHVDGDEVGEYLQ